MNFLRLIWRPVRLLWGKTRLRPDFVNLFVSRGIRTFHVRPKRTQGLFVGVAAYPEVGIVVQGPLMKKFNFTYETLKLYKRMWPESEIVFSTWLTESKAEIARIRELGVLVLESKQPKTRGRSNLNLQTTSTFRGVEQLSTNVRYVLKTRSDQRIHNPFCLSLMLRELDELGSGLPGSLGLVTVSLDSFSNREWGLSDFISFSRIETAAKFWAPIAAQENFNSVKNLTPEQILSERYAQSVMGPTVSWEIALCKLYAIVDASSLDLLWPKYSAKEYRWKNYTQYGLRELSAGEWKHLRDSRLANDSFENEDSID